MINKKAKIRWLNYFLKSKRMSVELAKEGLPQAGSQSPRGFGMESCSEALL